MDYLKQARDDATRAYVKSSKAIGGNAPTIHTINENGYALGELPPSIMESKSMENDKLINEVIPHLSMRNVEQIINTFNDNMEVCYGLLGDTIISAPLSHAYQSGGWFYLHGENSDADDDLWNSESFRMAVKAHILKTYFGYSGIEWSKLDESFDNLMARLKANVEG